MRKHTQSKELILGARVNCQDGAAGRLSRIILDPENRRPTHLIVKRGWPSPREIVVPVSLATKVTREAVELKITRRALADFSDYQVTVRKGRYEKPMPVPNPQRPIALYTLPSHGAFMVLQQRNVPEQSAEVRRGMAVRDGNGHKVGKVEGITVGVNKQQGKYVLFQRSHSRTPRLIPAELVEGVSSEGVRLQSYSNFTDTFPAFIPRRTHARL